MREYVREAFKKMWIFQKKTEKEGSALRMQPPSPPRLSNGGSFVALSDQERHQKL